MDIKKGSRIAVIGAGISGIAAANILKKNGFVPIVFEKYERFGRCLGNSLSRSPFAKHLHPISSI